MSEHRPDRAAERAVLVHIGYHKTGSTWLQEVLFADPAVRFRLPFVRTEVNERIVAPKHLLFDAARERGFFDEGLRANADCVPVLSNERFSGNPHSGGWDSRILADRLAQLFPRARALIVIREQQSAIRSVYLQYIREGGTDSLRSYLDPPSAGKLRRPLFDFDFFAYHALVAYYQQVFGRERVLVLPYELLLADARDFAVRICSFCEIPPPETELPTRLANVSMSPLSAALKRPLNRWFVRDALNPGAPFAFERANGWLRTAFEVLDERLPGPVKNFRDAAMRHRIALATRDRYRESNARTADLTGLDLAAYGYPL